MRKYSYLLLSAAIAATAFISAGCHTDPANAATPEPQITQPEPTAAPAPKVAQPAPVAREGMITQRAFFPSGNEDCGQLLVEKTIPAEVAAGKPFEYTIKATNVSELILENVVVTEGAPAASRSPVKASMPTARPMPPTSSAP